MLKHPKFKTKEEVEEYLGGDKIECLLCGKEYKSLSQHIRFSHKETVREYHELFDIPHSHALVCSSVKERLSINAKKYLAANRKEVIAGLRKHQYRRKGITQLKAIGYQKEERKQLLFKNAVHVKPFTPFPKKQVDLIIELVTAGYSIRAIGRRLDMPNRNALFLHIKREPGFNRRYQEALEKRSLIKKGKIQNVENFNRGQ